MTGTAVVAPQIALRTSGSDHPDYAVIAGTGLVMIALSSLFLAYASRVIGLGVAWLALALLTNALVLGAKLVLAPVAFYQTTFVRGDPLLNVQSPAFFPNLAAALFILYAAAVGVISVRMRGKVTRALARDRGGPRRPGLVAVLLVVAVVLGVPLLLGASLSLIGYGGFLMAATGGGVILVVVLALAAGTGTMWQAARASISVRDTAIVTSVGWLALSMLLVYHVVWVVLMTILVSLWPLKTVAPSGK
jgi:hypothetical protein